MSFSHTQTSTLTIANARYLSSKVATDMHICAQHYGQPSEQRIRDFAEELAQYLNEGFLEEYEFGYQKNGKRILSWRYRVDSNGSLTTDDRPGNVNPSVDVTGASFFNCLTQNERFARLSQTERERFESQMPVKRGTGQPPTDGTGYWKSDRNYYSSGLGINRKTFQPFA